MRNTKTYLFGFAFVICVICAAALGLAVDQLREKQEFNVVVDKQRNVLKAVGLIAGEVADDMPGAQVEALYKKRIVEKHILGDQVLDAAKPGDGSRPIYLMMSPKGKKVMAYCIPVSGKGLWSTIYGYLALRADLDTVAGVTFYKHGETPGLGGEIEKDWFTAQFKQAKKIFDASGRMVSVRVNKGKGDPKDPHAVDGISGATFTGIGVQKFLKNDLGFYEQFFNSRRADMAKAKSAANVPPNGDSGAGQTPKKQG